MCKYKVFLEFAHELADCARDITLDFFRSNIYISKKIDNSPVTIADKSTEHLIRKKIKSRFPDHGIIGEEEDIEHGSSNYEWIVDPIDGTKNFISGYPLFGTLICLLESGDPVVSIIDIPAQDERFFSTKNTPSLYRKGLSCPVQINTNNKKELNSSILYSTDYSMFKECENKKVDLLRKSVSMVRYNGDCYLYAMLASGWIDIVLEADLKVYDFLPLVLIIEQSGGIITDWQGNKLKKDSVGQVIACANRDLHSSALSLIKT